MFGVLIWELHPSCVYPGYRIVYRYSRYTSVQMQIAIKDAVQGHSPTTTTTTFLIIFTTINSTFNPITRVQITPTRKEERAHQSIQSLVIHTGHFNYYQKQERDQVISSAHPEPKMNDFIINLKPRPNAYTFFLPLLTTDSA